MKKSQAVETVAAEQVAQPAAEPVRTPAVAWINPMTRRDGSRVAEGAYVLSLPKDSTGLMLKPGESLAVFQTKGGSYVVKARTERSPA